MTQPTYKKKLIEVAIPLEAINKASAKEKSIRHGHPSTLHLWWARRPLATCRAVLFAQLVDDPSSHPDKFPTDEAQGQERERLFKIIEELIVWNNSTNEAVLERAKEEIRRSCGDSLPSLYDPFSGGCSIPLESQRLGLPTHGSDLNPVAVMIGKAMIEIPPKFKDMKPVHPGSSDALHYKNAEGMSEDVRYYGQWIHKKALERMGDKYPKVDLPSCYGGGKATVVGWIWARTVPSPDPALNGLPVPLVRSFDLSSKKGKRAWVEPKISNGSYSFKVLSENQGAFGPAPNGTVDRQGGRCIVSGSAMPFDYIRKEATKGNMGHKLMAIVADGKKGRVYLDPDEAHEVVALNEIRPDVCEIELPEKALGFRIQAYGMKSYTDLFTNRQLMALHTFGQLVREVKKIIEKDASVSMMTPDGASLRDGGTSAKAYAEAVSVYLGIALSRLSDSCNAHCRWAPDKTQLKNLFGRQAIPMTWDFFEANPLAGAAGDYFVSTKTVSKVLARWAGSAEGTVEQWDAQTAQYNDNNVISCDPPYYDNIGYADLSDFFFSWMKPALKDIYPGLFGILATPKYEELIASPFRHGGREAAETHFLDGMRKTIKNMVDHSSDDIPATIYYAFKQSEIKEEGISSTGWATFLQAVIEAGYAVVGTWPMRTEMTNRMVASGTNALANSVVLVCRKKEKTSEVVTRAEFIRDLKENLPEALTELLAANIAPADIPQSSIGPGIGIFSRYSSVLESDDSPMSVKTALQIINRELDEYFSGIEGEFDAETRFAVTWFEQNGVDAGDYGVANNIATARGVAVESVAHAGIVASGAGTVRLLSREEMDDTWSPDKDDHLTDWECCQHLIRTLENDGEHEAAILIKKMGSDRAETAKDVAYRLYDICDKKGWAKEGTSYNGLIAVWSELTAQSAMISDEQLGDSQMSML